MKSARSLLAIGALVVLLAAPGLLAHPTPATVPTAWQLDLQHKLPRRIVVTLAGEKAPRAFWYLVFTVTNPTSEQQNFLPTFDLLTEDGTILPAQKGVDDPAIFAAIKKKENNKLLEPLADVRGRLLPGEDQARTSVAIWPEPSPRMGKFSIFVGGLSGESKAMRKGPDGQLVEITDAVEASKDPSLVYFWKTLQLDYQVLGDEFTPGNDPVQQVGPDGWIMR